MRVTEGLALKANGEIGVQLKGSMGAGILD
jgi:hypothetical protein